MHTMVRLIVCNSLGWQGKVTTAHHLSDDMKCVPEKCPAYGPCGRCCEGWDAAPECGMRGCCIVACPSELLCGFCDQAIEPYGTCCGPDAYPDEFRWIAVWVNDDGAKLDWCWS